MPLVSVITPTHNRADLTGESVESVLAGSFQDFEDADRTKAELALLGLIAEVQTVTINQATWHRVRVGPYQSVRAMDVVRRQLQENRYDVLVLNERG